MQASTSPSAPTVAVSGAATAAPIEPVSAARANYVLLLVTLVYAVNFIDRNILNVLLQPIKQEFNLSDTMLGFMSGIGFTAVYVLCSIPLARLADRVGRVPVISGCLAVWSAATAMCGLVGSATQLVLARCVVGAAEGGSGGPGQALLADLFPKEKRARAMSFLSTATFLGVTLAFVAGSAINRAYGWRMAFILAGLPGLLLSLVFFLTVKETSRKSTAAEVIPVREALAFLVSQKSIVLGTLAFCCASFASGAITAWVAPMLQRVHGLSNLQAGLMIGPVLGGSGIAGGLLAAALMTRLSRRDMRWTLWANALSMLIAAPAMVFFCFAPSPGLAIAALGVTTACSGFQIGPFVAALQTATLPRLRALTGALNMATTTLLGFGLGPLVVGLLSDALTPAWQAQSIRVALLAAALMLVLGAILAWLGARRLLPDIERAAS